MIPSRIFVSLFALFICFSFTSEKVNAQDKPLVIDLENQTTGPVISPLLFGHNLEVTRRGFWGGLSAQMVANRKFAATQNGLPKQWKIIGNNTTVNIDTTINYAGRQSLSLNVSGREHSGGISQQQQLLAVKKGDAYVVRLWVKTNVERKVQINLFDSVGQKLFSKRFKVQVGDWELITSEFAATSTSANCRLEIVSRDSGQCWIGAVSLMPLYTFHGMRSDVVELLKKLKPGCLRFPGGCYAEFYSWKDGLLPVDKRSPIYQTGLDFLLRDTDDTDNHEIGIDEFIALCKEVGAEPIITSRVSENTPQDIADWVSYCNGSLSSTWGMVRIERGFQEPFHVRWWFVGNELYSEYLIKP
jgi:alpha-N-arabinofuranosidase